MLAVAAFDAALTCRRLRTAPWLFTCTSTTATATAATPYTISLSVPRFVYLNLLALALYLVVSRKMYELSISQLSAQPADCHSEF
jgi:hypothetical protein